MNEAIMRHRDCEDVLNPIGEYIKWVVYYSGFNQPCGSRIFRADGTLISEKGLCPPLKKPDASL